jgi:DNA-binding transcriptional regulator YhcF (GntR family)
VVDDIVTRIRDGRLQAGQRLPSTRELADLYGAATMTAQRALRELQVRGATYGAVGKGTFVRHDAVARLSMARPDPGCLRCGDESACTQHLAAAIGRATRQAEQLEAYTSPDVARVAGEVRRLASILAGRPNGLRRFS